MAAQIAQLQVQLEGETGSAAASEASDLEDPSTLDMDFDDEGWKKVSRETRKAFAAALAGKLAPGFSKVARAACPFVKGKKA